MKPILPLLALAFLGSVLTASATLTIPSDGSDGAFSPTTNVEIDLGLATSAAWNSPGTGTGVYDAEKWAVVYKFSSVNIPNGVKVTFKNHPSYAPVVWLVQGGVTIAGELNLDGKTGTASLVEALTPTEPGPGGFRGGATGAAGDGSGFGPGGSNPTNSNLTAATYASKYGNPQVLPLIGGSGSGSSIFPGVSGSAGGGAIGIFAGGTVVVNGTVSAKGGQYGSGGVSEYSTVGSGGAVKIVAEAVSGGGSIRCLNAASPAGTGRIRIETNSLSTALLTAPETVGVPVGSSPIIWPAANAPKARVVSVDAISAPVDPHAPLVASADVAIQNNNPVNILIETRNFPIEGVVQLTINPKFSARTTLTATRIGGDINVATWQVTTVLPQGFVTLQARATQP